METIDGIRRLWPREHSPARTTSRPISQWRAVGLLTVSAKVQGEQETVTGKITFKATD